MSIDPTIAQRLRAIPAVAEVLAGEAGTALCDTFGAGLVKLALHDLLDDCRRAIRAGRADAPTDMASLTGILRSRLVRLARPAGRRAVNATGILLHTGLGRAPLGGSAMAALAGFDRYSILQTDPDTGKRCLREAKVERMLQALTGCQAATVVNNNAAATMLILNTLAAGREVIVSRGQLIEIGGAFRLPDVMAKSGAALREVGTTNRTHMRDYEGAIGEDTGAIIHVHTSNYRVRGFSGTPDIRALVPLGHRHGFPVIDDLGSGALVPLAPFGLPDEPLVADSIKAGADVCCFSGDKLICGPQCGIVVGTRDTIARIRKNPFARMFRVCKMTLAALEATLAHFVNGDYADVLPFYRMLGRSPDALAATAGDLVARLDGLPGCTVSAAPDVAYVGSGSVPDQGILTTVLRCVPDPAAGPTAEALARRLRLGVPSVFCRVQDDALLFDMRTLLDGEADILVDRLRAALAGEDA
jgi:L-seryl-tRNA(Ser) seleniumtransferase